jgi:transcriptional regulator with XRE-family HTH domain
MNNQLQRLRDARALGPTGRGRRARETARLSLTDFARAIDVDPASLCRWEHGGTRPRRAAALRWLAAVEDLDVAAPTP